MATGMTEPHMAGLSPETQEQIRKAAAELVAQAPPLTPEQIKAIGAIFNLALVTGRKKAA